MKRTAAALALVLLGGAPAGAQPSPGDPGAGVARGVQQVNNSGQVGTVTLFRSGPSTRVEVVIQGSAGRPQSVRLYRGASCDDLATGPTYFLADVKNGTSRSSIGVGADTLLSGNYNVVVFSNNRPGGRATACGHLYQ